MMSRGPRGPPFRPPFQMHPEGPPPEGPWMEPAYGDPDPPFMRGPPPGPWMGRMPPHPYGPEPWPMHPPDPMDYGPIDDPDYGPGPGMPYPYAMEGPPLPGGYYPPPEFERGPPMPPDYPPMDGYGPPPDPHFGPPPEPHFRPPPDPHFGPPPDEVGYGPVPGLPEPYPPMPGRPFPPPQFDPSVPPPTHPDYPPIDPSIPPPPLPEYGSFGPPPPTDPHFVHLHPPPPVKNLSVTEVMKERDKLKRQRDAIQQKELELAKEVQNLRKQQAVLLKKEKRRNKRKKPEEKEAPKDPQLTVLTIKVEVVEAKLASLRKESEALGTRLVELDAVGLTLGIAPLPPPPPLPLPSASQSLQDQPLQMAKVEPAKKKKGPASQPKPSSTSAAATAATSCSITTTTSASMMSAGASTTTTSTVSSASVTTPVTSTPASAMSTATPVTSTPASATSTATPVTSTPSSSATKDPDDGQTAKISEPAKSSEPSQPESAQEEQSANPDMDVNSQDMSSTPSDSSAKDGDPSSQLDPVAEASKNKSPTPETKSPTPETKALAPQSKTPIPQSQTAKPLTKFMLPKRPRPAPLCPAKPPAGRSMGVILSVGDDDLGVIERDDKKTFPFQLSAFVGIPANLIPGVKVHFTVCKTEENEDCATDVNVPSGGTEEVHSEVFVGVVTKSIKNAQFKNKVKQLRLETSIYGQAMELPFTEGDCAVTLVTNDLVTFQVVTSIVTKGMRAVNVRPKVPDTFRVTDEERVMGVIKSLEKGLCCITSEQYSGVCLYTDSSEDLGQEEWAVTDRVEFTRMTVQGVDMAVRVRKLPEGMESFNDFAEIELAEEESDDDTSEEDEDENAIQNEPEHLPKGAEPVPEDVSAEKYDGVVLRVPTRNQSGKTPATGHTVLDLGSVKVTVNDEEKRLTFSAADVLTKATMLVGDKVQLNISTNPKTKAERAVNVHFRKGFFRILTEQRKTGMVIELEQSHGYIKYPQDPKLFFDLCEIMEEHLLSISDKVEFTVMPKTAGLGNQAIRVKKVVDRMLPAKLEALVAKNKMKKKMTIKISSEPKDQSPNNEVKPDADDSDAVKAEVLPVRAKPNSVSTKIVMLRKEVIRKEAEEAKRSRSEDRSSTNGSRSHSRSGSRSPTRASASSPSQDLRSESADQEKSDEPEKAQSLQSSTEEVRKELGKERQDKSKRSRSRSRERSSRYMHSRSRERSRDQDRDHDRERDRQRDRDRERERDRDRDRQRDRDRDRDRNRDRDKGSYRRRSRSPVRYDGRYRKGGSGEAHPHWSHSRSPGRDGSRSWAHHREPPTLDAYGRTPYGPPKPYGVDEVLIKKQRELEQLNELIAQKKAMIDLEDKPKAPAAEPKERLGWGSEPLASDEEETLEWLPQNSARRQAAKPIKSILKKPKEPAASPQTKSIEASPKPHHDRTHPMSDPQYRDPAPVHPVSQLRSGQSFSYQEERSYREPAPYGHHSVPSHSQVHHTPSPPSSSRYGQPPPPQHQLSPTQTSQSLSGRQQAAEDKRSVASQMQRFLGLLNKGVDINQLTTLIKESVEKSAASSTTKPPVEEGLYKSEPYDPFKIDDDHEHRQRRDSTEGMIKDDLLPHERAVADGSGFSRILGLSHEPQVKKQLLGQSIEKENLLYGTTAGERNSSQYGHQPEHHQTSVPPGQYSDNPKSSQTQDEQKPSSAVKPEEKEQEKEQYFDKVQNLLKAIGLNLNSSEVTQLTDRMKERLYGTTKTRESSSESKGFEHSSSRHRSRTHSADSMRSASPAKRARQDDYRSNSSQSQHSRDYDPEDIGKKNTDSGLTPDCSRYTPESTSQKYDPYSYSQDSRKHTPDPVHLPSTSAAPHVSSSSSYSHSATNPSYPYPYSDSSYSAPRFSQSSYSNYAAGHASYPSCSARAYDPFASSAGYSYPSAPHGIPASSSSYSESAYPLNPGSGDPYTPLEPSGTSSYSLKEPKQVNQGELSSGRCLKVIEPVTSETLSHLVQVQMKAPPMLTEEDVKARQKEKQEQFTQRMKEKHERLMEAMRNSKRTAGKTEPPAVASKGMKNVWICGHSLVDWAEKRVNSPEFAMQLGMDPNSVGIWWKGVQGMTWDQLVPQLHQLKLNWPNPDLLLIHLGGNDINKIPMEELLSSIKKDLTSIHSIFPKCRIVWSDILPRRFWKDGSGIIEDVDGSVNKLCGTINRKAHAIVAELGGSAVTHDNIGPGLYRPNGIHLSKRGIDTFNLNLQDYLEKWENETSQGAEQG